MLVFQSGAVIEMSGLCDNPEGIEHKSEFEEDPPRGEDNCNWHGK